MTGSISHLFMTSKLMSKSIPRTWRSYSYSTFRCKDSSCHMVAQLPARRVRPRWPFPKLSDRSTASGGGRRCYSAQESPASQDRLLSNEIISFIPSRNLDSSRSVRMASCFHSRVIQGARRSYTTWPLSPHVSFEQAAARLPLLRIVEVEGSSEFRVRLLLWDLSVAAPLLDGSLDRIHE